MKKYGKDMWGKLGKCIKIRITKENFKKDFGGYELENREYSIDEIESIVSGLCTSVPIEIADDVEGYYEAVCENGIEIH